MNYSNADKLTAVLSHWLKPMGEAVGKRLLGNRLSGIDTWIKGVFPVSQDYSIMNDLSFLMKPSVDMLMSPAISKMLAESGVADEAIPEWAHKLTCEMHKEVQRSGSITMFDAITLNESDVAELKGLLERNLPMPAKEEYQLV